MTIEEIYKEEYVPAWEGCHEEGEPASFEEWKENELREDLKEYIDNLSYEEQMAILGDYIEYDSSCGIPYFNYMDSIDEYANDNFIRFYDSIDHDKFSTYDDVFYGDDCIRSCKYGDFINDWFDLEDVTNYVIENFERLYQYLSVINDYEYEYEE